MAKTASRRCLLHAWKCAEIVFGRGFAPDPTGGAYRAPPDTLVGGEGLAASPKSPNPAVSFAKHLPKTNPSYGVDANCRTAWRRQRVWMERATDSATLIRDVE